MTWPGYLAYVGDMGSFLFSRIPDMFEFFRGQSPNPDYWSEKLQGPGPAHQAILDFDHDAFDVAARERGMDVWEPPFNAQEASRLLVEDGLDPYDLPKLERYSTQFLWACHAIPWAIARYDELVPRNEEEAAMPPENDVPLLGHSGHVELQSGTRGVIWTERSNDDEVNALIACMAALSQLDANGAARVAGYLESRFPFVGEA